MVSNKNYSAGVFFLYHYLYYCVVLSILLHFVRNHNRYDTLNSIGRLGVDSIGVINSVGQIFLSILSIVPIEREI